MPVPSDPTVDDIILHGMREAGQYTVTTSQAAFTDFKAFQFAAIKTEMWNACRTDRLLETDTTLLCPLGKSTLTLPTDFDNEITLYLYDADDSARGTAQSGTAGTITLASNFSSDPTYMYGRYLFTLAGTGSGQHRQVTNYNDSTKVVTLDSNWTTVPDSTTQYFVGIQRLRLTRLEYMRDENPNRRPEYYTRIGTNLLVFPAADKIYPILMTYRANLTRLDDTGTLFVKHLRERRHLWVQGVKAKTASRFDDDRAAAQQALFERMLAQYAAQNVVYERMAVNR